MRFSPPSSAASSPARRSTYPWARAETRSFSPTQGWEATGFDPAEEGLKVAQAAAAKAGVAIKTVKAKYEEFDFGRERWDLIVFCYAFAPLSDAGLVRRVHASLKPGGMVLIEHPMNEPESAMHPHDRCERAAQSLRRRLSPGVL